LEDSAESSSDEETNEGSAEDKYIFAKNISYRKLNGLIEFQFCSWNVQWNGQNAL
jgi:hypothetical protein